MELREDRGVDRTLYRLRNLVERCLSRLKNARRIVTQYDKTAENFSGFIDTTSIRLWFRHMTRISEHAVVWSGSILRASPKSGFAGYRTVR